MHVVGSGEPEIARIAGLQRGLVNRDQLLAAGLGRSAISHRLRTGRLHRRHREVYVFGRDELGPLGEELGAVLYYRGHAILSHRSAMFVWDLVKDRPAVVSMTIVGTQCRSRRGIRMHRVRDLDRRDLRVRHRLPLTAPARTLLDFASEGSDHELEEAVAAAIARRLTDRDELQSAIARAPGRRGAARLKRLIEFEGALGYSRSHAERHLRRLLKAARLPLPVTNTYVNGLLVDFVWPQAKLIVEVDGYEHHGDRAAFERDRRRDQILVAAGYRVIRVTWRQLRDEPIAVIARLAQALAV